MAIVEVDFSRADKPDYQPLPEGWYEAEVHEARLETSSRGTRIICFELGVLDPPEYCGRRLWLRNAIDGRDHNRHLRRTLTAMGLIVSGVSKIDLCALSGCPMSVLVRHELYRGKVRERVVGVAPAGKAAYERAGGEEESGDGT